MEMDQIIQEARYRWVVERGNEQGTKHWKRVVVEEKHNYRKGKKRGGGKR